MPVSTQSVVSFRMPEYEVRLARVQSHSVMVMEEPTPDDLARIR